MLMDKTLLNLMCVIRIFLKFVQDSSQSHVLNEKRTNINLVCWKTFTIYPQQPDINKLERYLFDTGTEHEIEPIYTNGRIYFNYTGDICNKKTNETFNLIIILTCDYSSHIRNPIILMPYVSRANFK